MYNHRPKERGTAIIVALFIITLVTIAAVTMAERLSSDIRRTTLLNISIQSELELAGATAWGLEQLLQNLRNKAVGYIDQLPIEMTKNKIPLGSIASTIYAADGLFNLNNLLSLEYGEDLQRLLEILLPSLNQETRKTIALAVHDWVAPDAKATFTDYYIKQDPPYRAPHKLMSSVSEFRLMKGVTQEIYTTLLPYITALPEVTKINVNSAPEPVLLTLNNSFTKESARRIIALRKSGPFNTLSQFLDLDIVKNHPVNENKISISSNYFLMETNVTVAAQENIFYTLIQRTLKDGKPNASILWQTRGTL